LKRAEYKPKPWKVADPDSIDLIINNNMIFSILIKKT